MCQIKTAMVEATADEKYFTSISINRNEEIG